MFIYHVSLASSGLWQCLRFSLFWSLWLFWGVLIRYFVQCPSICVRLMVLAWLDWGMEVIYPSLHVISGLHTTNRTHHWWCPPWAPGPDSLWPHFSVGKSPVSPPQKPVTKHSPYSKSEELGSTSLKSCGEYLQKLFGTLPLKRSFVQLWIPGYLFCILDYKLSYLFCCPNCSRFVHWWFFY